MLHIHTPHVTRSPDFPPQLMTEDLTTRAFPCKVEGCGRTLIGLFQFATHEKYFHKLAASERASQCFMHSCPIAPCTMEYVRREDLRTHIGDAHPAAVPHSSPGGQKPRSENVSPPSQESSINTPISRSSSSFSASPSTAPSSSPSLATAAVKISESLAEHQHIEKQLGIVLGPPGQGNLKGGPGGKRNENRPAKVQPKVQYPLLPCPHVHCTHSFASQSLLDKHIAKRHKRGVKFHVVPGVATLEPPFSSHDQTLLELQSIHPEPEAIPKREEVPSIISSTPIISSTLAIAVPPQTVPGVHVQGRGRVSLRSGDLLIQVPKNSGTGGSSITSVPNQVSQQRANQTTKQPAPPSICPFPNCGQTFSKVRQRDRHLAQVHFSCPGPTPAQGPVLTEPDLLLPNEPVAGVIPPTQPSMAAPGSGIGDQKDIPDLRVEGRIPAQNLHSRDVLTCPVYGCSEIFNDLKGLLVHGRDLHGLLDSAGLDALGLFPAPPAPSVVTVPAPTKVGGASGQDTPSSHPVVSGPNPVKPIPVVAKAVAVVPPVNVPEPSIRNQDNFGPKSMRCLYPGCNSIFTQALDFRYHEKNIHGLTASAQCASMYKVHCHSCQKSYWTQESLDRHVLEKHQVPVSQLQGPGPIPARQMRATPVLPPKGPRATVEFQRYSYRCELCRLDFPTAVNLNYHQTKSSYHRSLLVAAAGSQARAKGSVS